MPKTKDSPLTPIQLDDQVKLRKPHACGGFDWTIVRLGADIGLKCNQCGRRVLLPRMEFERRLVRHTPAANAPAANAPAANAPSTTNSQSDS